MILRYWLCVFSHIKEGETQYEFVQMRNEGKLVPKKVAIQELEKYFANYQFKKPKIIKLVVSTVNPNNKPYNRDAK